MLRKQFSGKVSTCFIRSFFFCWIRKEISRKILYMSNKSFFYSFNSNTLMHFKGKTFLLSHLNFFSRSDDYTIFFIATNFLDELFLLKKRKKVRDLEEMKDNWGCFWTFEFSWFLFPWHLGIASKFYEI